MTHTSTKQNHLHTSIFSAAQIEVGDIQDSVLSSPVFSVTLDMKGDDDTNLCYEISGEPGVYLNLVSDVCFSINAHYEAIEGVSGYNKIEEVAITASDAAGGCSNILISAEDNCASASVSRDEQRQVIRRLYRRNGLQIDFKDSRIEVTLPCRSYPGGGVRMITRCNAEYEDPFTFEKLPIKNLELVFNRAKLPASTDPQPHGLLGETPTHHIVSLLHNILVHVYTISIVAFMLEMILHGMCIVR